MGCLEYKRLHCKEKFSLEEVLQERPNSLLSQFKTELGEKPLRSGAEVRIRTLRTLCELIENQNKKLEAIHQLVLDLRANGVSR